LADQAGQESWTPMHFGYNNRRRAVPVLFNDPTGLNPPKRINSGNAAVDAAWAATSDGERRTFTSNGDGTFSSEMGVSYSYGVADLEGQGRTFNGVMGVEYNDRRVTVRLKSDKERFIQGMKGYTDPNAVVEQWFEAAGNVPIVGEMFDGMLAVGHAAQGNYAMAGASSLAMIPFVGTGLKYAAKAAITGGAKKVLKYAVANPNYVGNLKKGFPPHDGTAIHLAFMENATKLSTRLRIAEKLKLIKLTKQGVVGPDIVGTGMLKGTWWDVTTKGKWDAHLADYADPTSAKFVGKDAIQLLY
jgi:hypothetical protein